MNKFNIALLTVVFSSSTYAANMHSPQNGRTVSYQSPNSAVSESSAVAHASAASTASIIKRAESSSSNKRTLLESVGSMGGVSISVF